MNAGQQCPPPLPASRPFSAPLFILSLAAASSQGEVRGGAFVVKVIYVHGSKSGGEIQLDAIIHG